MRWYALHVASNCESQVCDRLDQANVEAFFPYVSAKSRDGRREVKRKFFAGYVFAKFQLNHKTPVVACPMVIQILGMGGSPVPVPVSEIEAVRLMVQSASASLATCPNLAAGETVIIQRGPLQGLEGVVLRSKGKTHVVVSINLLRQSVSCEINAADCDGRQERSAIPATRPGSLYPAAKPQPQEIQPPCMPASSIVPPSSSPCCATR